MEKVNSKIIKKVYPKRDDNAHKYDFGLLIVIGGSDFYSGSPALTALAAFRTGVDMVNILAPKRAADIIASFSPNLASYSLTGDHLTENDLSTLLSFTKSAQEVSHGKTAVVIGGGLGRTKETQKTILKYLSEIKVPAVIDADAIHAISSKPEVVSAKNCLITPHEHEFSVLTGQNLKEVDFDIKAEIVKEKAGDLGTTILLKGGTDIISDGISVARNEAGNPFMTVGGTGDVLAGVCGSLLANNIDAFQVGKAGSFINAKAGDIAGKEKREGLVATDIIDKITEVLKKK